MKINFSISRHIRDYLLYYILALIIIPLTVSYAVLLKTQPASKEKFTIFVGAAVKNEYDFKKTINKILPEDLEINIHSYQESDSIFFTMLNSRGENSDILILSNDTMTKVEEVDYVNLTNNSKYNFSPNYVRDEKIYGLTIRNEEFNHWGEYIDYLSKEYFIFINKRSVHLNGICGNTYETNQVSRVLDEVFSL